MRTTGRWGFPLLVIGGLALAPALALVREIVAADKCVAAGGSYDYLRALCYMSGVRGPGSAMQNPLAWIGLLFFAKVGAVFIFGLQSLTRRPLALLAVAAGVVALAGRRIRLRFPRSSSRAAA